MLRGRFFPASCSQSAWVVTTSDGTRRPKLNIEQFNSLLSHAPFSRIVVVGVPPSSPAAWFSPLGPGLQQFCCRLHPQHDLSNMLPFALWPTPSSCTPSGARTHSKRIRRSRRSKSTSKISSSRAAARAGPESPQIPYYLEHDSATPLINEDTSSPTAPTQFPYFP